MSSELMDFKSKSKTTELGYVLVILLLENVTSSTEVVLRSGFLFAIIMIKTRAAQNPKIP